METQITVESDGARLGTTYLRADDDSLAGPGGRPCVVMAHGFGATRDSGLRPFAEAFTTAGADVLLVDYRGFADSEGPVRRHVDHRAHRRDYHAAVARARLIDGVDPERIVLWGSSYSGGHVVAVAAQDPRIAGVIAQGAAMDGLGALTEILRYAGPWQLLKVSAHAIADAVGHALGRPEHRVAIFGPPGTVAAITAPDAEGGYGSIIGPSFVNDMPARDILTIPFNRPVTAAPQVRCPMLLVVAASDSIAPPSAVRKVAATAGGPVETLELDCGHFDVYVGEPFATSIERQVAFVRSR
ncbi:alpha/beta fold hydrolase [Actinomycetospora sp. NBRC 106378]|uniref:alpha/beta hydrolase n=1 Tax=Actinomycetospora sp. NBRC 106378 TaxID=3032208 RepID=UPI0024A32202|nr:alpha/beta fold hydrolase [Actinomycetospora sp. NBRC 106378]GLZ56165.1 alpha/beta hydrolase [Actinomycetospora sp. NBRC 106378]